jgi:hypothetical protein
VSKQFHLPKSWQYFLLGVLLWTIVDFGTAGGFRITYFQKYGLTLLLFYVGYPLLFSVLIFKLRWSESRLFLATLITIFIIEIIFTRNPLLMTFPALIWGIPLAIMIYTPLTFFPLWIVRKEIAKHGILILALTIVELIIMMLTTFGNSRS